LVAFFVAFFLVAMIQDLPEGYLEHHCA
jgi:hypothetical protein